MIVKRLSTEFRISGEIADDQATITSLRALPPDAIEPDEKHLYLGEDTTNSTEDGASRCYLLAHGKNRVKVFSNDYVKLLNAVLAAFDFYNIWEANLEALTQRHAPIQEMLDISDEVLSNPAFVMDFEGHVLGITPYHENREETAFYRDFRQTGIVDPESTSMAMVDRYGDPVEYASGRIPLVVPKSNRQLPFLPATIINGGESVAIFIVSQSNRKLADMDRYLMRIMLNHLWAADEFRSSSSTSGSSLRSNILHRLLEGQELDDVARSRLESTSASAPYVLLIFQSAVNTDTTSMRLNAGQLLHAFRTVNTPNIHTAYGNSAVAVVSANQVSELVKEVGRAFGLKNWRVGISLPFTNMQTIPLRRRQAHFAIVQGDSKTGIFRCEDHAFEYLLSRVRTSDDGLELRHPAIILLKHYDEEHHSKLGETLFQYLRNGKNLVNTAGALFVHRNSLAYRIKRICEICNIDLEDPDENAYILFSFYLERAGSNQQRHLVDRTYSSTIPSE